MSWVLFNHNHIWKMWCFWIFTGLHPCRHFPKHHCSLVPNPDYFLHYRFFLVEGLFIWPHWMFSCKNKLVCDLHRDIMRKAEEAEEQTVKSDPIPSKYSASITDRYQFFLHIKASVFSCSKRFWFSESPIWEVQQGGWETTLEHQVLKACWNL